MWGVRLLTWGLPWVAVAGVENPYIEPKLLLWTLVGWGLVLWRFFRLPPSPVGWRNPWMVWLIGWAVGQSCWKFQWLFLHRSPGQSEVIYNHYAWLACLTVILASLMAYVLTTAYFLSDDAIVRTTQWFCWGAGLVAIYGLFQFIGWDQFYVSAPDGKHGNPVHAGFGNPGYVVLYLAVLMPLCFVFAHPKYLWLALLTISVFVVSPTTSGYPWAVAGIGIVSSLMARWWRRLTSWRLGLVLMGAVSLASWLVFFAWQHLQVDQRLSIWTTALTKLRSDASYVMHPFTGYGLESFSLFMRDSSLRWAHNEWIQMLVELGVIGTVLLAGLVWWTTRMGWRIAQQSVMASGWFGVWIAWIVVSVIHFPGHIPPMAWVGLCAFAILERGGMVYA